ncbi:MAG: hypothetical protein U0794_17340, partial [Isosphaeraceae bacterium]
MGRRLRLTIGFALALAAGAAHATGPGALADPPAAATERPAQPSATGSDAPAELPPDFGTPSPMPGSAPPAGDNLGPRAPTAGTTPAEPAKQPAGKPEQPSLSGALGKLWAKGKEPAARSEGQTSGKEKEEDKGKSKDADVARTQAAVPARGAPPATTPVEEPPLPAPVAVPGTAPAPADLGTAPALPPPAPAEAPAPAMPAPRDPALEAAQAAGNPAPPATTPVVTEANPLPAAALPPGTNPVPSATPTAPAEPKIPFVLSAEDCPLGRQTVGLTVDVVAPQVLNLNQTATFKIVVRNNGQSDARGVVVRDRLPEGLAFVSSSPAAEPSDSLLVWNLGTVPAGSEKIITLTGKPGHTGAFDHAATVSMMAASKARTI